MIYGPFGAFFFALITQIDWIDPLRSLGMCGLIRLMIYRGGVTDVLHVTREELKRTRKWLASEDWIIYHTETL